MPYGKLPQNILDGLPLQDADSAAAGGEIQVVGGQLLRYFSPVVLGINGVGVSNVAVGAGFYYFIVTPYLDLRGCQHFQFLIRRNVIATVTALGGTGATLFAQARMGSSDAPAIVWQLAGSINEGMSGKSALNTAGVQFVATSAGNSQSALITWSASEIVGVAGTAATIGSDVRLVFSWGTNNPNPGDGTFTAQLWGG